MRVRFHATILTSILAIWATPALAEMGDSPKNGDGGTSASSSASTSEAQPADTSNTGGTAYGSTQSRRGAMPVVDGEVAKLLPDGRAAAPSLAPPAVQRAIWAANRIVGMPYFYGGGHVRGFTDPRGYDCSGTISYALHGGRLLRSPLDSSSFMAWGAKGQGNWITVWTNPGHAFVVIAGLRLDTSAAGDPSGLKGPRWRPVARVTSGFRARHPAGY